jgi:DNA-binding MarR family transcriptional regulator
MTTSKSNKAPGTEELKQAAQGLETFLTYRLHLLNKLTDKVTDARYEALGITLSTARCIAALGSFGSLSVNSLAARANLDKSQASRVADLLVQREYVLRTPSTIDQRGVELTLTRTGAALFKQILRIATKRNNEVFECLSEPEREAFGLMLTRLLEHAREQGVDKK